MADSTIAPIVAARPARASKAVLAMDGVMMAGGDWTSVATGFHVTGAIARVTQPALMANVRPGTSWIVRAIA